MLGLVVFIALLFWAGVFAILFAAQGTNPLELLFGRYEPLPDDLGTWRELGMDEQGRLVREERSLLPPGRASSGYLLHQVRYRDPATREIMRVELEQRIRRRRVNGKALPR